MESDPDGVIPTPDRRAWLAELAHDLKTPLTSLKMSIHLLQEDAANLTAGQRELLAAAVEDLDRLHAMVVERLDKPRKEARGGGG